MRVGDRLDSLIRENQKLKQQLLKHETKKKTRRSRPGNRDTKSLRHLRLSQKLVNAIVLYLQGSEVTGTFVTRNNRQTPMSEKVKDLTTRYKFSLSSVIDEKTDKPALNVQTLNDNSEIFRVVPIEQVSQVIRSVYTHPGEGGFRGRDAIYSMIRRSYVGVTRSDVQKFLDKRPYRQQYKRKKKRVSTSILPSNKRGVWQIDFIKMKKQNNQYRYVCVIVDMYSKYLWAFPLKKRTQFHKNKKSSGNEFNTVMKNISGSNFLKKLQIILDSEGGGPKIMQSDNEFRSRAYVKFMTKRGIELKYSLPYSPQTNGGVERINGTLKSCLMKCMLNINGRWIERDGQSGCLPQCVYSYNNHINRSTGKSPVEIHRPHLRHPVTEKIRQRLGLKDDMNKQKKSNKQKDEKYKNKDKTKIINTNLNTADVDVTKRLRSNAKKRLKLHRQDKLKPGDLVRVRIIRTKPVGENPNKIQRLGGHPNWSEEVYVVDKNLGRNRYTVKTLESGKELKTDREYYDKKGNTIMPKRLKKFMRHQLLKIELASPEEEPFDPLLQKRIQFDMKQRIGPIGLEDVSDDPSRGEEYRVAIANQKHINNRRQYSTRNRKVNAYHNTRGSNNPLLKPYDDPSDYRAIQAMEDAGTEPNTTSTISKEDLKRVDWELGHLGLNNSGNDSREKVNRLLLARKLNHLNTSQLRTRLSTFTRAFGSHQNIKRVALDTTGARPQLLARLICAINASKMTVKQMRAKLGKQKFQTSKDVFLAFVRLQENKALSDEEKIRLTKQPASSLRGVNKSRLTKYLNRMSKNGVWGGEIEVKAAAENYNVRVHVFSKIFLTENRLQSSNIYLPKEERVQVNGSSSQFPTIYLLNLTNTHYRLLESCNTNSKLQQKTIPYDRSKEGLAFSSFLKSKYNLCEVEMGMDGNCLFHCLARALGQPHTHLTVRKDIVAYMQMHPDRFTPFV